MSEQFYTIGEVSSILNISRDMIRYYEKRGVLHSQRDECNYRRYTTMDIFWLAEAVEYKSWGIEIGDIPGIRNEAFTEQTVRALDQRVDAVSAEVSYKKLYLERLRELRERTELCLANIGNFWVRRTPAYYVCHLVNGINDDYERITVTRGISAFHSNEKILPFIDSGFYSKGRTQEWVWGVRTDVIEKLGEPVPDGMRFMPAKTCLCTNVDIGEVGKFKENADQSLRSYAAAKHCRAADEPEALLIARGRENDTFRRVVEYRLPIVL